MDISCHRRAWLAGLLLGLTSVFEGQADVYRCTGENGHISYQQFRCHADSKPLSINTAPVGWTALRSGERELLNTYGRTNRNQRPTERGEISPAENRAHCEDQRRQLATLNRRLRRGYALKDSDRLHEQQRHHRRYLYRHCTR